MTGRIARFVVVVLVLIAVSTSGWGAVAAQGTDPMRVELDSDSVEVGTGKSFSFRSTITNLSDQSLTDVIANVNVVSSDGTVYVDPEDWSSDRTQYLDSLAPGASAELSWNVRAVTTGDLILYVAVTTRADSTAVVAGGPLRATVTATKQINAAGVLPVALGVPAVVVMCAFLAARKRHQLA